MSDNLNLFEDLPEGGSAEVVPASTVWVHFETAEDMVAFSKLIGQQVTRNTAEIWWPLEEYMERMGKKYVQDRGAGEAPSDEKI